VIFSLLYLFIFSGIFLIIAKIFNPNVGMYYKGNEFRVLGMIKNIEHSELKEVLGYWFIPAMFIAIIILYLTTTLLLKLKRFINHI